MRPQDSLERLFGKDWVFVARFNRIDRRHAYPGMTIKVPENMEDIRNYTPLPAVYEPARKHAKYILLNVTEQWLGAYEYGRLVFSMPAATGIEGHLAPTGIFRAEAYHRRHTSSLYKTAKGDAQYPMDYAIRFLIDKEQVSYWIHARDLPGRPASHGCVGVFDEAMQHRVYGVPDKPVLEDAKKLYAWTIGEDAYPRGRRNPAAPPRRPAHRDRRRSAEIPAQSRRGEPRDPRRVEKDGIFPRSVLTDFTA